MAINDNIVKEVDLPKGIFETLIINNDLSIKNCYYNFHKIITFDKRVMYYHRLLMRKKIVYREFKVLAISYIKYFYEIDLSRTFDRYFRDYVKNDIKIRSFLTKRKGLIYNNDKGSE